MTLRQLMNVLAGECNVFLMDTYDNEVIDCYEGPNDIDPEHYDLEVDTIKPAGDGFNVYVAMPRYKVEFSISGTALVTVRAKSEDEAMERAEELVSVSCGVDIIELDVDSDAVDDYEVYEANIECETAEEID